MAYITSENWKNKVYGGDKIYVPYLLIDNSYVPVEQISNIDFIENIIDDSSEKMYIGTFISNQIDITFKRLDNLNIESNKKVYLEIGLNTDYKTISSSYIKTDENGYKYFRINTEEDLNYLKKGYFINIEINNVKFEKIQILNIDSDENGNYFYIDLYQLSEIPENATINILPFEYIPKGHYLIDILDENYYETCQISCLDYAVLMKSNVDYKDALDENGEIRIEDLLIWLCNYYNIKLGTYPDVNRDVRISVYDSTLSGKTYISYIAELMGGNAKINRLNELCIFPLYAEPSVTINALKTEEFKTTENYEISCVYYTDGTRVFQKGDSSKNTLQIRQENMFITEESIIHSLYNSLLNVNLWSLENRNLADPSLDCWDIINFQTDKLSENIYKEFKTLNNCTINYSISIMTEIKTKIPTKQQENTTNLIKTDNAVNIRKIQTEINQLDGTFKILAEDLKKVQSDFDENYYTKGEVNEFIANAKDGIVNTYQTIGGDNIFRNTGLWFRGSKDIESETLGTYKELEFWEGNALETTDRNSSNTRAITLLNNSFSQTQVVKNGNYTISFTYKKLIPLSTVTVNINGVDYELTQEDYTEFTETVEITTAAITITFVTDINNSCVLYDLMVNYGETKMPYTQNPNETTTTNVQISKGITINSTETNATFKADADGIRINNKSNDTTTEFTETGMITRQAKIVDQADITGLLISKVGEQTWLTWLE